MKKLMMITAAAAFVLGAGVMAPANANAGTFKVSKCKTCHAVGKKKVGPAWKDVAAAYGSPEKLQAAFEAGFGNDVREYLKANSKWKSKAGMMKSPFKKYIKGNEAVAAKALFDAVAAGKI